MPGLVVVAGGTGFVGSHLVRRLAGEGQPVRALARAARAVNGVQSVAADLLLPDRLGGALEGAEVVVHCAAITADHKEAYRGQYYATHALGTRNLVEAARRAGVKRIVLMNGLGTKQGSGGSYMRTRWEMAEAVRTSGLPWVALQPSILFGAGAAFPEAMVRLARSAPVMPLLGGGALKLQPLWVEDLVTCLQQCIGSPRWDGRAIDLGGPEQLTYREVVDLITSAAGIRRPGVPMPLPLARLAAGAMRVLPNPPLVPATLELFDFDNITDLDAVKQNFGFEPRSMRQHFREHGLSG